MIYHSITVGIRILVAYDVSILLLLRWNESSVSGIRMLLFLSTCFAFILPVESWWDTGHMLTAAIALKNLKKAKVVEATNLLSNLPGYTNFGSDFVSASHWADDIKRNHDAYAFSSWHFIKII